MMNIISKQTFCSIQFFQYFYSKIQKSFATSTSTSRPTNESEDVNLLYIDNEIHGGKIAIIGLNRPKAKNSMSKNLLNLLHSYTLSIAQDESVRVVILRSLVPGVFCAGADLHERFEMTNTQVWHHTVHQRRIMNELENLPMPVIAAIDGVALGGGLEIALSCDLRVAANSAKIGLVETKLAIIPGAGGTQRLSRVVGRSLANELIMTGRILDGLQAEKIGLVNRVVEQNETRDAGFILAVELAKEILPNGPVAVRMAKFAINRGSQVRLDSGMKVEELCYAQIIPTKDRIEGLQAFKDKRSPKYTGE